MDKLQKNFNAILNSKEFKAYFTCLKKDKEHSKEINTLVQLFKQLEKDIKTMGKVKKGETFEERMNRSIKVLELVQEILKIESNQGIIHYAINQCPAQLENLTIKRNDIQLDNLKETQKNMESFLKMMKEASEKEKAKVAAKPASKKPAKKPKA